MELEHVSDLPARSIYMGNATVSVPAGQWMHIRHGDPASPIDDLLQQVPVDKSWSVTVVVNISESDA